MVPPEEDSELQAIRRRMLQDLQAAQAAPSGVAARPVDVTQATFDRFVLAHDRVLVDLDRKSVV